jgi:ergothioneine biosynthesis protein EgtB
MQRDFYTADSPRQITDARISDSLFQQRYIAIRQYSEYLCEPLEIEDYVVQPIADVSPPKWHLAHSTWFFEEFILKKYYSDYKPFDSQYSYLFNSYYESVGDRVLRPHRGSMSRPTVEDILLYRKYVDHHMIELLQALPQDVSDVLQIGFNHEQQHQELLLTDIKYILGNNPLFPVYRSEFKETREVERDHNFITIPQGTYKIGFQGNGFSYDNEHQSHSVLLQSFQIRKSLVTNGEYLEFMKAGGYQRADYWHSDGWTWVKEKHVVSPLYWHFIEGSWHRYALSGLERVNPDEPITHISFYEAAAFAEWSGLRLPTEFEWEASCDEFAWGQRWEYTNSAYLPYPGYAKPAGAIGEYNGKFMINTMVLRGASIATPKDHSRKSYRNFFTPELQWQFNGIRLCRKN